MARYCYKNDLPLLGICYGAEIIAQTFGGSLRRMPRSIQGNLEIQPDRPNPITGNKKSISVYESHGLCIARLPEEFDGLASSAYCPFEIFAHRTKKIFGLQFHPEKSGQDGLDVIESFVKL